MHHGTPPKKGQAGYLPPQERSGRVPPSRDPSWLHLVVLTGDLLNLVYLGTPGNNTLKHIRCPSGWCASYWNAFLFYFSFLKKNLEDIISLCCGLTDPSLACFLGCMCAQWIILQNQLCQTCLSFFKLWHQPSVAVPHLEPVLKQCFWAGVCVVTDAPIL